MPFDYVIAPSVIKLDKTLALFDKFEECFCDAYSLWKYSEKRNLNSLWSYVFK